MPTLRDPANPGRLSGTNVSAIAQGGISALIIPALLVLNRHFQWGLSAEEVITLSVCAIGLLQAATSWYQRRATAKVESLLRGRTIR